MKRFIPVLLLCVALTSHVTPVSAQNNNLVNILQQALEFRKAGKRRAALKAFRAAVKLAPGNTEIRYNYGVVALEARERFEAMSAFQRVVTQDPKHALAQFNLGKLLNEQKQAGDALPHLLRAAALLPKDPAAQVEFAWTLAALGYTDRAEVALKAVQNPTAGLHNLRAFLALRQARWSDGVKHATAAVRADPTRIEHRVLLATAMLYTDGRLGAIRALKKLLETDEGRRVTNIVYTLGLAAFLDGDLREAKHRWSGLQGRNAAVFNPSSADFEPMAFATESDMTYLRWAKGWFGPGAAPVARILELRAVGAQCHPGPILTTLLNKAIAIQRCLGMLQIPVPVTIDMNAGTFENTRATVRERTEKCLVEQLNGVVVPNLSATCAVTASVRSAR